MCEANVSPMDIQIAEDPSTEFKTIMSLMKDSAKQEDKGKLSDDDSDIHTN
jgi:hypothetical protein